MSKNSISVKKEQIIPPKCEFCSKKYPPKFDFITKKMKNHENSEFSVKRTKKSPKIQIIKRANQIDKARKQS